MTEPNGCQHGFECPICLESLNSPADVDGNQPVGNAYGTQNPPAPTFGTSTTAVFGAPNPMPSFGPVSNVNPPSSATFTQFLFTPTNTAAKPKKGSQAAKAAAASASATPSPTDICATFCGHMFHTVCLNKWFKDQKTRDCPNCRKIVNHFQIIKIYPNPMSSKSGTPAEPSEEIKMLQARLDSLTNQHEKIAKTCKAMEELIEQFVEKHESDLEEADEDLAEPEEEPEPPKKKKRVEPTRKMPTRGRKNR